MLFCLPLRRFLPWLSPAEAASLVWCLFPFFASVIAFVLVLAGLVAPTRLRVPPALDLSALDSHASSGSLMQFYSCLVHPFRLAFLDALRFCLLGSPLSGFRCRASAFATQYSYLSHCSLPDSLFFSLSSFSCFCVCIALFKRQPLHLVPNTCTIFRS